MKLGIGKDKKAKVEKQPAAQTQQPAPAQQPANQPQNDATNPQVQTDKSGRAIRPKKKFTYVIVNDMGKNEKRNIEAESEQEVRTFLTQQELKIVTIKPQSATDMSISFGGISPQDLSFSLTQLSTYIKSGIPLAESVRILAKQSTKDLLKNSFNQLHFELLKGENLSTALEMQNKVYPALLINMVKTAEMTGDLPTILDDMAEYYTSMDQTRKQMKSAMTYPLVVLTLAFGVLIFMLTYLVPQFTSMFESNGAELPAMTKMVVGVSDFLKNNYLVLIGVILGVVITFVLCYKKLPQFKKAVQIFLMHIPVIKNVIIYNEISNFTKTFASLLNHGVYITDSMEILQKITNNEVYKEIINNCLTNLAKGETVSSAFKGQWAIPIVAYEMIVTGEKTGQLGGMMEKVAKHFQLLHKNIIDQMKSLVEPLLIVFLAIVAGIILISIIQPMFAIYDTVK
jgi:type IV pilus assembly protein PilC